MKRLMVLFCGLLTTLGCFGTAVCLAATPTIDANPVNSVYNCLNNQALGQAAPQSSHSDAKYLYITLVVYGNGTGDFSSNINWAVAGSLKGACDFALRSSASDHSAEKGWKVMAATVELVPDGVLKEGLSH